MNHYIAFFLIGLGILYFSPIKAQEHITTAPGYCANERQFPCVQNSNTNPCTHPNGVTYLDGERPTFDWTSGCWPVADGMNNTCTQVIGDCFIQYPGVSTWQSPFYYANVNLNPYIQKSSKSDFLPQEGWVLLRANLGKLNSALNKQGNEDTYPGPSVVLYNKYSAVMRIICSIKSVELANQIGVEISFDQEHPENQVNKLSGLFGVHGSTAQPLDQYTSIKKVLALNSSPPNDPNGYTFFVVDVPVAYDPCTCHYPTLLNFKFVSITTSNFKASGRNFGFAVPIADNDPIDPNYFQNYLNGVTLDGSNDIASGNETFKLVRELKERYEAMKPHMEEPDVFKEALEMISGFLTVGLAVYGIPEPGAEEFIAKTLEAVASGTEFLSARLGTEEKKEDAGATVSAILSETKLVGKVESTTHLNANSFSMVNPGSKCSTPGSTDLGMSFGNNYNEVLGTFALLETPEILKEFEQSECISNYTVDGFGGVSGGCNRTSTLRVRTSDKNIKYVINPALDVDSYNIKAAYVVKTTRDVEDSWQECLDFPNNPEIGIDGGLTKTNINIKKAYETKDAFVYMTPFVGLDCLNNFTFEMVQEMAKTCNATRCCDSDFSNADIYLRLIVNMEFMSKDRNGNPNRSVQIFTYPTKEKSYDPQDWNNYVYQSYPFNLTINNQVYTQSQTIFAWDKITIEGDISTSDPNVEVTIIAGDEIVVKPDSRIGPNIHLKIGNAPLECNFNGTPQLPEFVSSFCNKATPNLYKANESVSRVSQQTLLVQPVNTTMQLSAYPNPTTGEVWLKAENSTTTTASAELTDLTGRVVLPVQVVSIQEGVSTAPIQVGELSSGVYLLKITVNGQTTTSKLVLQKE